MPMGYRTRMAVASLALFVASGAQAQLLPVVGVEAATDENRRGLSWSEGRATASADVWAPLGPLEASARVAALRGSSRHGGSDAVADLSLGMRWDFVAVTARAGVAGHVFAGGRGDLAYGEITSSLAYTLGPVRVDAGANYAPHQDAIGGSNLYLYAGATAGIPTTPFTLIGRVGRSSGDSDSDGDVRAGRLRPTGTYTDWRIGLDHVRGPLTLGLDYVGTDIDENAPRFGGGDFHDGDRLIVRARLSF